MTKNWWCLKKSDHKTETVNIKNVTLVLKRNQNLSNKMRHTKQLIAKTGESGGCRRVEWVCRSDSSRWPRAQLPKRPPPFCPAARAGQTSSRPDFRNGAIRELGPIRCSGAGSWGGGGSTAASSAASSASAATAESKPARSCSSSSDLRLVAKVMKLFEVNKEGNEQISGGRQKWKGCNRMYRGLIENRVNVNLNSRNI